MTPSSTQRAVSSAWMTRKRCFSSSTLKVSAGRGSPAISDQAGPQSLRTLLRIIVEALAVLAAEAAALDDHFFEQRFLPRIDHVSAEIGLGGLQNLPGQIDRDLVVQRKRADRHAGHAADILDHRRRHAFGQHQVTFADVGADHARGVEAAASRSTTIGVFLIART